MLKIMFILLLFAQALKADCISVNLAGLEKIRKEHSYFLDKKNNIVLTVNCVKADASKTEVIQSLQKSGTVKDLDDRKSFHIIQENGVTIITVFDFGKYNGQLNLISQGMDHDSLLKLALKRLK